MTGPIGLSGARIGDETHTKYDPNAHRVAPNRIRTHTRTIGLSGCPMDHRKHENRALQTGHPNSMVQVPAPSNRSPPATFKSTKASKGDLLEGAGI